MRNSRRFAGTVRGRVMLFGFAILVACLGAVGLASAIVLYALYRFSPPKQWRSRVEQRLADAGKQLRAERRELENAPVQRAQEERALERLALDTFLRSISVAEL